MSEENKFTYSAQEMIEVLTRYANEITNRPAITKELEKLAYALKVSNLLLAMHYGLETDLIEEKTGEKRNFWPCVTIPVKL